MSMTPRSTTTPMPFDFSMPIDPGFHKVLQSKIRTLLHSKAEEFPGSYPVNFEPSHLQQLASEEYFVLEKFASIDRHNEISFVPHLLLPLRDNPLKYQNETLLDGEMVAEHDGQKMLDQDILGVHASKPSDVKAKEPFIIERKTMQRSYGMNIILSGSRKQKQGAEGLIFVPVKQPYIAGTNPKLFKWKSHTTAQFLIKVTLSKERKPLYCIHVKQGTSSKFYDYVTPDSVQAAEWDAQWQTQMFEKGYGLETRTGGWRFNRVREDRKDVDEESTVLALVKSLETLVTKEQLESNIDHIRRQWKAREAGVVPNGTSAHSSAPAQRPPVRPLSISNTTPSHGDGQAPLLTPSLSSHYLQSPSVASHSSSQGYFSRKDRERKASTDEYGSSSSLPTSISGTFSHPLPPKPPPYQPRHSSVDQSQPCSPNPPGAGAKNSEQEQQTASPSSASSSVQSTPKSEEKSIPPTISQPATTAGTSTPSTAAPAAPAASTVPATSAATFTPTTIIAPTSAAASIAPGAVTTSPTSLTRNPLKLSQVQAHLQPIKSWMTVAPVPRAPLGDKATKLVTERRDSRDASSLETSQRPNAPASRKSSVVSTDGTKDGKDKDGKDPISATAGISTKLQETKNSASINIAPSSSSTSASQDRPLQTPQTPTPAQTPTITGTSRSAGTPSLPTPVSFNLPNIALPNIALPNIALPNIALPSIALPNTQHRDTDEKAVQETESEATSSAQLSETSGPPPSQTSPTAKPIRSPSVADISSSKPSPVLGKRAVALSSSAGERPDDSLAQRRKLSDAIQPSPKSEAVTSGIGSLNIASTLSPNSASMPSFPPEGTDRGSPLLSPLGSPGVSMKPTDHQQPWSRSQSSSGLRTLKTSNLSHEVPPYRSQGSVDRDVTMAEVKDEAKEPVYHLRQDSRHGESKSIGLKEDVDIEDAIAPKVEQGDSFSTRHQPAPEGRTNEAIIKSELRMPFPAPTPYQPPTPAFVVAVQGTYSASDDQEKARAMALARAAASSKLEMQLEQQITKEKRLLEDIEKFKESSRTKKEKSVKQRTREATEPAVQDRRAQPVRQINQQQGKLSNPDSPALRSQSQLGQRVGSSPQEQQQQRLAYTTRQSRSNPRVEPAQNVLVNSKPQHRSEQQPVPIEQIDPTGGQVPKEQFRNDHFPPGDRPDSREQMEMLHPEDVPRQHRRINSMDHHFQQARPASPSRFDPRVPQQQQQQQQQQVMPDGHYGQPHSKRLDLGQHGDAKHRRSRSDVGIFHQPIVTAIVAPQPIARPPQGPVPMEGAPSPQAPPPGAEYRQNGHFSQGYQRPSPTGARSEIDETWAKYNNSHNSNGSSSGRDAPPVKESKARLQFILNDDPTSPEGGRHDEDSMERPQSPDIPDWNRRNPTVEPVPRVNAPHMTYADQPHMPHDYLMREHQEARLGPQATPMASANPQRRQPPKKQKLSQDVTGQELSFNSAADEYEYQMRQAQLNPQARPPPHGPLFQETGGRNKVRLNNIRHSLQWQCKVNLNHQQDRRQLEGDELVARDLLSDISHLTTISLDLTYRSMDHRWVDLLIQINTVLLDMVV
ncbi:Dcp1p-Dcp2p decapping enzyme complex alpha subunit [Linnemannia zychae]|nr:Dcp1p-Dcp2p decapping enzyme complex alpha subunit [Linnemannia zychae]